MSLYTESLQQFAKYSKKIDNAAVTEKDLLELQRIKEEIAGDYNKEYFSLRDRNILHAITEKLIDDCKEVIRVNYAIKEIEKEIRKQRRKEAAT